MLNTSDLGIIQYALSYLVAMQGTNVAKDAKKNGISFDRAEELIGEIGSAMKLQQIQEHGEKLVAKYS